MDDPLDKLYLPRCLGPDSYSVNRIPAGVGVKYTRNLSETRIVRLRILIADDNEVVRLGVRTLLRSKRDWEACGDATNGREAISKVWELSPDVVILDLSMPVMNGFEAAAEIRRIAPSIKIVFLSVHDVPTTAREVGADAFVSKTSSAQELIATIEGIAGSSQHSRAKGESA
jgi:two-component system, NarL family, nitrate/nitrite response regulator NarL